ncbi:hypothetical protein KAI87_07795 [Myxococcota bacterium]|nr:hypothetical protein [Myxococcota bacterium]
MRSRALVLGFGLGACSGDDDKTNTDNTDEIPTYTLSITVTPADMGTIVSADETVSCSDTCSYVLTEGTTLTLSAEAGVDYKFEAWSGECSVAGACEITMDADLSVGASFEMVSSIEDLDPDGDADGDGLINSEETGIWGTSPWLADTDGDGYSDGDEIVEYGFDPTNDPFKFNPLVADVPKIKINLVSPPGIELNMTSTVSSSTMITAGSSRETSTSVSNTETTTNTTSTETSISRTRLTFGSRWGDHFDINTGPNTYNSKTTEENSFSWSETQSTENTQAYNESVAMSKEEGFTYNGGRLSMLVKVENNGNIAFTLSNLVLSALQVNAWGDEITSLVGNLSFDSIDGVFPETTLGPGAVRDTLIFDKDDIGLNTTLALLKDSRGLLLSASTYELLDANGVAFNHALTEVRAKTAQVIIDYGPGTGRSPEYHMVATNIDFTDPGVTLDVIFEDHLFIPYTVDSGLVSVRGVLADSAKRQDWSVMHLYKTDGEDHLDFLNTEVEAYDFESIKLRAGDILHLIYRDDEDNDGLGHREEFLYGTDIAMADTDSDGLDDGTEIYGYAVPTITLNDAFVRTNPTIVDTDGDGDSDGAELTAKTDPTSHYPLKYQISSPGDYNAEALDSVADAAGNLYVVGYGTNLPSASGKDWWIKMIDANGVEVWDRRFDGGEDGLYGTGGKANAVALSQAGELYVVGYHALQQNMASQRYWWVKKFEALSGIEATTGWDKSFYRDTSGLVEEALDVAVDSAGNVYVVGYIKGSNSDYDWKIRKFSPAGVEDTSWNKSFDSGGSAMTIEVEDDQAVAIVIDSLDNVYVGGYGHDLVNSDSDKDWRIVKYNSSGDTLWVSELDAGHFSPDIITDMDLDATGDLYVSGYGTDLAGQGSGVNGVVRKFLGSTGVMVDGWERVFYGGSTANADKAYGVLVSDDDNIYVTGETFNQGSKWFVKKYATDMTSDAAPASLTLPAASSYSLDVAHCIVEGPDGSFYIVGSQGFTPSQTPELNTPHSWWLEKFYDWTLPVEE